LAARRPVGLDEFFLHRRRDIVVEGALHDEQRHQRRLFPALEYLLRVAFVDRFPRREEQRVVLDHAFVLATLGILEGDCILDTPSLNPYI
jgi:hypothetical protein